MANANDTTISPGQLRHETKRLRFVQVTTVVYLIVFPFLKGTYADLAFLAFTGFLVITTLRRIRELDPPLRRQLNLAVTAAVLAIIGAIVRQIEGDLHGVVYMLPSIADPFSLVASILFIWAIFSIIRSRNPRLEADPIIDAAVATVAVGVVQWSVLYVPYISRGVLSTQAMGMNILYGIISLVEVAAATLALVAGSKPSTANRLLAAGLIGTVMLDAMSTIVSIGDMSNRWLPIISSIIIAVEANGIVHPSSRELLERPDDQQMSARLTRRRLTVLTLALVTPPVLTAVLIATHRTGIVTGLPLLASFALTPLVVVRLARLVRQNEEMAQLQAKLRVVSEHLLAGESEIETFTALINGAEDLLELEPNEVAFVATNPADSQATTWLEQPFLSSIDHLLDENAQLTAGELIDLDIGGRRHAIAGVVKVRDTIRGALIVVTDEPLSRNAQIAIATMCRETAMALRAVEHTERRVRKRSEARFESLVSNSSDVLAVLNPQFQLVYFSSAAERLLGFQASAQSIGTLAKLREVHADPEGTTGTGLDLVHPDHRRTARAWLNSVLEGHAPSIELPLQHFDGTYSWFELAGTDRLSDPDINGIVLNVRDISDRKGAEDRLQQSEARFKALVQNTSDLVVVYDANQTISYASPSVTALTGLTTDEVMGSSFNSIFLDNDLIDAADTDSDSQRSDDLIEFHFTGPGNVRRTVEAIITDLSDDPAIGGIVVNARDVTERRAMQQQLLYQATHDELTGLANRPNTLATLRTLLAKNSGRTTVALILFDIDDLREVNDSLGHEVGDRILIEFADRLAEPLDHGDLIARVAGDEFVVMVERSLGEDEIMDLAYEMKALISEPFIIDGREISISVSAGLAFDHDRTNTAELLLRNADTAMHRSKPGRNTDICVFEPHMHTATFDRLELRADLARAIAHNQFVAFYQPIVDLATSRIIGAEALVRWQHPHRGLLGPNVFIPLAEETGMINAIGEWMLRRATHDLSSWMGDMPDAVDDFTISVNLSPEQLHDSRLVGSIEEILRETSVPSTKLVLEVTESTLITESEEAARVMATLRQKGIKLSIDDFGTGYSSLGYIQQFEFDVLKIDKSFVDHITTDTNQRIVETIIDLATNLGVKTVAEGIEDDQQLAVLRELGCLFGQGYWFSRPVPEGEFRRLLSSEGPLPIDSVAATASSQRNSTAPAASATAS